MCKQHDTPIGTLPVLDGPKHKIGWKINIMKNFPRSVYHYPLLLVALCHYLLFSVWLLVALFFSLFLLSDSGQLSGRLNLPRWQAKQLTMHKNKVKKILQKDQFALRQEANKFYSRKLESRYDFITVFRFWTWVNCHNFEMVCQASITSPRTNISDTNS